MYISCIYILSVHYILGCWNVKFYDVTHEMLLVYKQRNNCSTTII